MALIFNSTVENYSDGDMKCLSIDKKEHNLSHFLAIQWKLDLAENHDLKDTFKEIWVTNLDYQYILVCLK